MRRPAYIVAAVALALCCAGFGFAASAFADEETRNEPAEVGAYGGYASYNNDATTEENATAEDSTSESGDTIATNNEGESNAGTEGATESSEPVLESQSDRNLVDPTQRADNSFIYDTSIGAITGQSSLYDNRTVQVEGEVIGDRIAAGDGNYWIELSSQDEDDSATISVLMSEDQTAQIDRYGRYGITGTTLQVRGTYHQACNEHEGLSDIHATNSAVVALGVDHPDEFNINAFLPGAVTVVIGIVLLLVFRFARERMR